MWFSTGLLGWHKQRRVDAHSPWMGQGGVVPEPELFIRWTLRKKQSATAQFHPHEKSADTRADNRSQRSSSDTHRRDGAQAEYKVAEDADIANGTTLNQGKTWIDFDPNYS